MSRLSILIERPKRTLMVLVAVLASLGVVVASGADFSAQTANPGTQFATGSLTMSNSQADQAVFAPTNMKPGEPRTGTIDIGNTGTIAGTFTFSRTNVADSDATNKLSEKLNLVVKDCGAFTGPSNATAPTCEAGDAAKYTGTLAGFTSAEALGTYAAGEKHRYEFTATVDPSAGDAYQGDNTSARFQWDAVQ